MSPLHRRALLCAVICVVSFVSACAWGFFGISAQLKEGFVYSGVGLLAVIQMASGFTGFVATLRARREESMSAPLTVLSVVISVLLSSLGFLTLPIAIAIGAGMNLGFGGSGRPLRASSGVVLPSLRATDIFSSKWVERAKAEYASAPAFARLSWQLASFGAPVQLVERCHRAALEELQHARLCFSLGAKGELTPLPMPQLGDPPPFTVASVAMETLIDGCWKEAESAAQAEAELAAARDEQTRAVLEVIARDERAHAELSWDVLRFCIERGGERVLEAVERELPRLPRAVAQRLARVCALDGEPRRLTGSST